MSKMNFLDFFHGKIFVLKIQSGSIRLRNKHEITKILKYWEFRKNRNILEK